MELYVYALALEQQERARQQAADRRATRPLAPGRRTPRGGLTRRR